MTYVCHVPSAPLNAYIDDLYGLDGPAPYRHLKVFPMPSLHLMINLGEAFQVRKPDQVACVAACAESWVTGLWSSYHLIDWPLTVRLYGIHFKPGGAYPFLQLPLIVLQDQVVSLDDLWRQAAAEIRERLAAAPTIQAGLVLLEQFLRVRLEQAPHGLEMVQQALAEIDR
jgi:hypothetical protein